MSDTPRTDAMIYPVGSLDIVTREVVQVVHVDDCRSLERELTSKLEDAERRIEHLKDMTILPQNLEIIKLQQQLAEAERDKKTLAISGDILAKEVDRLQQDIALLAQSLASKPC